MYKMLNMLHTCKVPLISCIITDEVDLYHWYIYGVRLNWSTSLANISAPALMR